MSKGVGFIGGYLVRGDLKGIGRRVVFEYPFNGAWRVAVLVLYEEEGGGPKDG